jgi:nitroreductase
LDALEAIFTRWSAGKVMEERPPREQIERLLESAVRAPNHHLTQPWRFFVIAGEAREELGNLMAEHLASKLDDPTSEQAQEQLRRERAKAFRAPVLIVVAASPSRDPKVVEVEEIEATAAAVENLLLAAHAMGLGAMWRTGDIAYDVRLKRWLGLRDDDHVVAIVYVGYPATPPRQTSRKPAGELTRWIGWESS